MTLKASTMSGRVGAAGEQRTESSASPAASGQPRLINFRRPPRKARGYFNFRIISIAFISYVISNQMALIILGSTSPALRRDSALAGHEDYSDFSENMIDTQAKAYKLSSLERSLVQLIDASPTPLVVPATSRSTTSVSHRVPPMNGSIFGKRSLDSKGATKKANNKQTNNNNNNNNNNDDNNNQSGRKTSAQTSGALHYDDIITELIEDFMSRNSEGDPAEATVAFCRMIVYECNQVIGRHHGKSKSFARRS